MGEDTEQEVRAIQQERILENTSHDGLLLHMGRQAQ